MSQYVSEAADVVSKTLTQAGFDVHVVWMELSLFFGRGESTLVIVSVSRQSFPCDDETERFSDSVLNF